MGTELPTKKNMKGKLAKKCNKQQNKSKVTNMRNGKGQGKKQRRKTSLENSVTSTIHCSCWGFLLNHDVFCPLKHAAVNVNIFAAEQASNSTTVTH